MKTGDLFTVGGKLYEVSGYADGFVWGRLWGWEEELVVGPEEKFPISDIDERWIKGA